MPSISLCTPTIPIKRCWPTDAAVGRALYVAWLSGVYDFTLLRAGQAATSGAVICGARTTIGGIVGGAAMAAPGSLSFLGVSMEFEYLYGYLFPDGRFAEHGNTAGPSPLNHLGRFGWDVVAVWFDGNIMETRALLKRVMRS